MNPVIPKKSLGQHFLTDKNIARKIVDSLTFQDYNAVLEVGPGTGILTELLLLLKDRNLRFVEIDRSSVDFLRNKYPEIQDYLITGDFLETKLNDIYTVPFAVIGNFPYNISSQIFFKILTCRDQVREVVCMIQKEVAVRISSAPGSRDYGILSVLLQAFYQVEYLFTVNPQVFNPPPKVTSSVIRMRRNNIENLDCNQSLFFKVVKTAFNQRRKMLRNSLKSLITDPGDQDPIWKCRPEQLGVQDFVRLTSIIDESGQTNT